MPFARRRRWSADAVPKVKKTRGPARVPARETMVSSAARLQNPRALKISIGAYLPCRQFGDDTECYSTAQRMSDQIELPKVLAFDEVDNLLSMVG